MKKALLYLTLVIASLGLTACSTTSFFGGSGQTKSAEQNTNAGGTQVASGEEVGGGVARAMDENDKSKLWRALDKPLGKSTQWTNENSGTTYTVVPTEKLAINGNPFCRKYTVTATRGGNTHEVNGTACVGKSNSNWESVS